MKPSLGSSLVGLFFICSIQSHLYADSSLNDFATDLAQNYPGWEQMLAKVERRALSVQTMDEFLNTLMVPARMILSREHSPEEAQIAAETTEALLGDLRRIFFFHHPTLQDVVRVLQQIKKPSIQRAYLDTAFYSGLIDTEESWAYLEKNASFAGDSVDSLIRDHLDAYLKFPRSSEVVRRMLAKETDLLSPVSIRLRSILLRRTETLQDFENELARMSEGSSAYLRFDLQRNLARNTEAHWLRLLRAFRSGLRASHGQAAAELKTDEWLTHTLMKFEKSDPLARLSAQRFVDRVKRKLHSEVKIVTVENVKFSQSLLSRGLGFCRELLASFQ